MDYKGPIEAALTSDLRGEPHNFSLWDIHTGAQLVVFKGNKSNPIAKCLQFIDSNYFVAAFDNVLQIWSIFNRKCQDQKLFLPGRPSVLITSPCGNYLIVGISEMIYIWQIHSGNLLAHTQRHYQTVSVLRINHDGSFFISGSEDGMVLVWPFADLISGTHNTGALNLAESHNNVGVNEPRFTWQHHNAQVTDIHITDGGRCVTASVDASINIYSYLDGRRLYCVSLPAPIWSVVMNKNETFILLGGQDGNIYQIATSSVGLSQMSSDQEGSHKPILTGHKGKIISLLISMDGSRLISASLDSSCKIWDLHQMKLLQDVKHQAPLANLTRILVPDSFALTSMTQSQVRPPMPIKPLKRQLYKMPQNGTIMRGDLFEESSTTVVYIKNTVKSPVVTDGSKDQNIVEFSVEDHSVGLSDIVPNHDNSAASKEGANSDSGKKRNKTLKKLRDLYLLSLNKIFCDAAEEALKPFKEDVDEIVAEIGMPKNNKKKPNQPKQSLPLKANKIKVRTSPRRKTKPQEQPEPEKKPVKRIKTAK